MHMYYLFAQHLISNRKRSLLTRNQTHEIEFFYQNGRLPIRKPADTE